MRHQKAALSKQREDYVKKANILKKELDTLKDQRNELRGDAKRSPSPDTKRFLKENTKLQVWLVLNMNLYLIILNLLLSIFCIVGLDLKEVHSSSWRFRTNWRQSTMWWICWMGSSVKKRLRSTTRMTRQSAAPSVNLGVSRCNFIFTYWLYLK